MLSTHVRVCMYVRLLQLCSSLTAGLLNSGHPMCRSSGQKRDSGELLNGIRREALDTVSWVA